MKGSLAREARRTAGPRVLLVRTRMRWGPADRGLWVGLRRDQARISVEETGEVVGATLGLTPPSKRSVARRVLSVSIL